MDWLTTTEQMTSNKCLKFLFGFYNFWKSGQDPQILLGATYNILTLLLESQSSVAKCLLARPSV